MARPSSALAQTFRSGVLALLLVGGCATGHMWHTMTGPQKSASPYYEPEKTATWTEYVGAALLTPLTLVLDIVLFPVQVIGGYWPYGNEYPP
jgi:uncharacterized protein YceK